ncbi:MAG: glycosyltransferase [Burkholderiales bacterium]|nr:glycosyltransferase [Burkholderiales bacterium]
MSKRIQWIFFASNAKPSSMRRALAYRLAEEFPVIVVCEALSLLHERKRPALADRIRSWADLPNLREYTPIHYPERLPIAGRWLKQYGRRRQVAELDQVLSPSGVARRIVCYDSPNQHNLVGRLGESMSIYLAIDDRTVTVWGEPIAGEAEDERELLTKVDRVICVSAPLAATLRARAPAGRDLPIDILTNGYDERLFDPHQGWEQPAGLESFPHPRVLVAGHVSERIDWEGVRAAATSRPAWSWFFVGPADNGMAGRIAAISKASGARMELHPPVLHEAVPAWIAHCDVCAVPYRLNDFTKASSPLKAIEYLGAGAPVLSTAIPSLVPFGDAIAWVTEGDGASYASALDALAKDARSAAAVERRCSAVVEHTLGHKARRFRALLEVA